MYSARVLIQNVLLLATGRQNNSFQIILFYIPVEPLGRVNPAHVRGDEIFCCFFRAGDVEPFERPGESLEEHGEV